MFSTVSLSKYFNKQEEKASQATSIKTPQVNSGWSIDLARDMLNRGDLEKLVVMATKRIEGFPNDAQPYWYRAKAYVSLGRYEEALKDVNKAESIAPEWKVQWTEPLRNAILEKLNRTQNETK